MRLIAGSFLALALGASLATAQTPAPTPVIGVVLDDFAKLTLSFPQIVAPLRACLEAWLGAAAPGLPQLLALCLINRFAGLWQSPQTAANRKLQLRRLELVEMALKTLAEER